eukprot:174826-Prymnesium_polylepis.1
MRASLDQSGVGSCLEERDDVDEQFRELCDAAGVSCRWEDHLSADSYHAHRSHGGGAGFRTQVPEGG